MKKLLSVLASCGLTVTTGVTVVACGNQNIPKKEETKLEIETSKDFVEIAENDKDRIRITNFRNLENVSVASQNESIVKITSRGEVIEFKGIKPGTTTILVSANNVENKMIEVAVEPVNADEIKLSKTSFSEYLDEKKLYSEITNFKDLRNLKIQENSQPAIVEAKINEKTQKVEIELLKAGTSVIFLRGENTKLCSITVEVKKLIEFKIDNENPEVDINKTVQVKITEMGNLKPSEIVLDNKNKDKVKVELDQETQIIKITGIKEGSADIIIEAKHAAIKKVKVIVSSLSPLIVLNKEKIDLYEEEIGTIEILNAEKLENIEVKSSNDKIALAGVDSITGVITVKVIGIGNCTIHVNAKHAVEQKIAVTTSKLLTIVTHLNEIYMDTSVAILIIANWGDISEYIKELDSTHKLDVSIEDPILADLIYVQRQNDAYIGIINSRGSKGATKIHINYRGLREKIVDLYIFGFQP